MSLSRYDRNRGRISRRDTSITSTNRGYAASHADSVPDWVKVRRSVATREDLMQFHDYLSNQMRHIYGTIKADGDELAQDTVKTLKWFDGKLQEEHGKMLQTISQLKEAAEGQTAVTGEQLVHADKVFGEFRAHVGEGLNAHSQALQKSLDQQAVNQKDNESRFDWMSKKIALNDVEKMEMRVQLMNASRRYEELEAVVGERLASYLSDQKEKKRAETSRGRRKPAGRKDVISEGIEEAGGEAAGTPQGDGVDVGMGGMGGGFGGAPPPPGDPSDDESDAEDRRRRRERRNRGDKSPKMEHYEQIVRHIHDKEPDTPTPDPWKYSGAPKEDLREWIGLCEDYFTLRPSKFKTENAKILWARFQTKDSTKAMTFATDYIRRMKAGEHSYESWDRFTEELCAGFLSTQEGPEALSKMQSTQYSGDIAQYCIQMETYNRLAKLSGPGLRDLVKRGLPEEINKMHDLRDETEDDGQFWKDVQWAGKKHEAMERRNKIWRKSDSKGGNGRGSGEKPKEKRRDGDLAKPKHDDKNRVSKSPGGKDKPKGKPLRTFAEATMGIPDNILDKRRADRVCLRCGKQGHACTFCSCKLPVVAAVSTQHKNRNTKTSVKTEDPSDKPAQPKVAATSKPSAPRIWEIEEDGDIDMVDWSVSDEEKGF